MSSPFQEAAEQWLKYDQDVETRKVVADALSGNDGSTLEKCFGKHVAFGTAGLRAEMGAGTARMNTLTIIQATQGLLTHVKEANKPEKDLLLVVGYDARHHSRAWAHTVAAVCREANVRCHLYDTIVPTPFVPFAVNQLHAHVGVMITASHNPKADNGYKVYWRNGVQIIPPHDSSIEQAIRDNRAPWSQKVWDTSAIRANVTESRLLLTQYLEQVTRTLCHHRTTNSLARPLFCYTPVHGVGLTAALAAFRMFSLPTPVVPESQAQPDPDFPTAPFPNPEEKGVLDEAQKTADAAGVPIVIANDPDADRMAVSEKGSDGTWRPFTGNEIGAMLGAWAWEKKAKNVPADKCWMVASAVSSKFLKTMADAEGFHFAATLTGFKWMGNKTVDLTKAGNTVLFAYEEAIGYMMGATGILDKDGVSAAVAMGELAVACYTVRGITLRDYLSRLFQKYGWHISNNSYYISNDAAVTKKIFARIRSWPEEPCIAQKGYKYPGSIGGFKVKSVEDFDVGSDSFMITLHFENKAAITLRTSGTEPKIKYYSEMVDKLGPEGAQATLNKLIPACIDACLQPEANGLLSART